MIANFAGLALVPSTFVPVARSLLAGQGYDPNVLAANGEISASDLFALAFDTVEIRTAYSPVISSSLRGPPNPRTTALLREVRPALTLMGRAGRVHWAPYGDPPDEPFDVATSALHAGVGIGLVFFGLGFLARGFID